LRYDFSNVKVMADWLEMVPVLLKTKLVGNLKDAVSSTNGGSGGVQGSVQESPALFIEGSLVK
jgi:hypothetical protein